MLNKQKGYLEHRFQEEIIELPILGHMFNTSIYKALTKYTLSMGLGSAGSLQVIGWLPLQFLESWHFVGHKGTGQYNPCKNTTHV